jgi:ketosteroid isomerase-like protein
MAWISRTILTAASALALAACSGGTAPTPEGSGDASAASESAGATPVQVVEKHVEAMKTGDLDKIMSDYAEDTVVITPPGLVSDQTPATGPGVFSGVVDARRVFAAIVAPDGLDAVKAMETRTEAKGDDVAFLYWTQFKGQPNEISGTDVFVVRDSKIVFQDIILNAK